MLSNARLQPILIRPKKVNHILFLFFLIIQIHDIKAKSKNKKAKPINKTFPLQSKTLFRFTDD